MRNARVVVVDSGDERFAKVVRLDAALNLLERRVAGFNL